MRPLKVSSRQMGRRLGVLLPPLGFARNSRLAALQVLLTAILAASLPRSGDAAWPRPSYSDAARRVSGPSPLDLGDAAARHARASADAATAPDLSPAARPRRVEPPHAGWGARRGHAPRPGTPFTRDEDDALSASRRRLLDDSGDPRALGELAWTSLADVPSRLRCSGCDLTLRALHAESALAARRLVPPSWFTRDADKASSSSRVNGVPGRGRRSLRGVGLVRAPPSLRWGPAGSSSLTVRSNPPSVRSWSRRGFARRRRRRGWQREMASREIETGARRTAARRRRQRVRRMCARCSVRTPGQRCTSRASSRGRGCIRSRTQRWRTRARPSPGRTRVEERERETSSSEITHPSFATQRL